MQKELNVYIHVKSPCEANMFEFLKNLQDFLATNNQQQEEITVDFNTMPAGKMF